MPLTSTLTLHPPFEKSGYGPDVIGSTVKITHIQVLFDVVEWPIASETVSLCDVVRETSSPLEKGSEVHETAVQLTTRIGSDSAEVNLQG